MGVVTRVMIDVNLIRQNAQAVRERYLKRGKDIDFTDFLKLDPFKYNSYD